MMLPTYQSERWFEMLGEAIDRSSQSAVARQLGVSPSLINQVVRGGGNYGTGVASTEAIARRVLDSYGNWTCPYLSDDQQPRVISAEQCRTYAHRDAPTGSPRDLAHWRACRSCAMKDHSAPPAQRIPIPRSPRNTESLTPTTAQGEPT